MHFQLSNLRQRMAMEQARKRQIEAMRKQKKIL